MTANPLRLDRSRVSRVLPATVGALCLALGIAGCLNYSNYPSVDGAFAATDRPVTPATEVAIALAVRWTADRYAPGDLRMAAATPKEAGDITIRSPIILNLPIGTRQVYYNRIARNCGPEVAPLTLENAQSGVPIYHVGRVWVRAHEAVVDVYRPMPELGTTDDGSPIYQMVTVRMEGGFQPYRVVHGRAWEPGAYPPPPLFPLPLVDRENEFEYTRERMRASGSDSFVLPEGATPEQRAAQPVVPQNPRTAPASPGVADTSPKW